MPEHVATIKKIAAIIGLAFVVATVVACATSQVGGKYTYGKIANIRSEKLDADCNGQCSEFSADGRCVKFTADISNVCMTHFERAAAIQNIACDPSEAAENQAKIHTMVSQFMASICGEFGKGGSYESIKVEGKTRADFLALLKGIADLGISGTAAYENRKYIGLPRNQLATDNSEVRLCRKGVWDDLKPLVLKKSCI